MSPLYLSSFEGRVLAFLRGSVVITVSPPTPYTSLGMGAHQDLPSEPVRPSDPLELIFPMLNALENQVHDL